MSGLFVIYFHYSSMVEVKAIKNEMTHKNTDIGEILTERGASEKFRIPRQTLSNWRHLGRGPCYLKIGKSVRYLVNDIQDYLLSKRINPSG